jgi:hypothetical protein
MAPLAGEGFCWNHSPAVARERAGARRRGGSATKTPRLFPLPTGPTPLKDHAAVLAELERVVSETKLLPNSAQRSRAIGYLLFMGFKALEVGELEERIAAIEERLAARQLRRA